MRALCPGGVTVWRLAAARRLVARDELGDVVSPDLQLPLLGVGQAATPVLYDLIGLPPAVGDVGRRLLDDDPKSGRAPELRDDGVRAPVAAVEIPLQEASRVRLGRGRTRRVAKQQLPLAMPEDVSK
eukprot:2056423-Prymnesium_polylepis.1